MREARQTVGPPRGAGLFLLLFGFAALAVGGGEKPRNPRPAPEQESPEPAIPGRQPALPPAGEPAPGDAEAPAVRVSGRVRLVGTGIFPQLVITGEDREWYIDREEESKLQDFQQRIVTVEGTETYQDLRFANGLSAGRRYTLKNIRVTAAEGLE